MNLVLIVDDLRMRMRGLVSESRELRSVLEKQEEEKKQFKEQVVDTYQWQQDPKKFKKCIVRLYKQYVTEEVKTKVPDASDATMEFQRKREKLSQNVQTLREKQTKAQQSHEEVNKRFMKQNVDLIAQINLLIQEEHHFSKQIKMLKQSQGQVGQAWSAAEEAEYHRQEQEIQTLIAQITQLEEKNERAKVSQNAR